MSLHPKPRDAAKVRTADPVELSTRIIDSGDLDEPTNRVSNDLTEVTDGVSVVESFSHMVTFATDDGLVAFDASGVQSGAAVIESLRGWSTEPLHSLVYTHGHLDHVGGSGAVAADAEARGYAQPRVVGHANVAPRFQRYRDTNGFNLAINARQFGGISKRFGMDIGGDDAEFLPSETLWPDTTYDDHLEFEVGGLELELHHGRGETDDHTWAWVPEHRALCVGDFVTWVFPNAGNPQKVQRYPLEWAASLRRMMTQGAELLLPAHGLPVRGAGRIATVLNDLATALEGLVRDTVDMMNAGESLDAILAQVRVPDDLMAKPWLIMVYDEPEFVVHNIWRLYGGWWDQNPARLKPARDAVIAREMADLAGGAVVLVTRAEELADAGDYRLACQLVEYAADADPESAAAHQARAEIYMARRHAESSLMAKGVFAAASRESQAVLDALEA